MPTQPVKVGRSARGVESTQPFAATLLRSSGDQAWEGATLFVLATGPQPEYRRFEFSEGTVLGLHLSGQTEGHVREGRHIRRVPFVTGQMSIMPYQTAEENAWREPFVIGQLVLSPTCTNRLIEQDLWGDPRAWSLRSEAAVHADPLLWQLGIAVDRELRSGGLQGRVYVESLIQLLTVHLLCHYGRDVRREVPLPSGLNPHSLIRLRDFVRAHLGDRLTLRQLAEVVGLSPYYLTRAFKRATGRTLSAFIVEQRLEAALQMMRHGQASLKSIALQVGFADQSHFSRHFKRHFGGTPAKYLLDRGLASPLSGAPDA